MRFSSSRSAGWTTCGTPDEAKIFGGCRQATGNGCSVRNDPLIYLPLSPGNPYGEQSFVVAQRTREVGVRIALGAEPRDILALFLQQGMRLIGVGILLGLLGGAAIAQLLRMILVDVSPFDPLTFGGVSLCLTLAALLATYLPARRAMQVDPMTALPRE